MLVDTHKADTIVVDDTFPRLPPRQTWNGECSNWCYGALRGREMATNVRLMC